MTWSSYSLILSKFYSIIMYYNYKWKVSNFKANKSLLSVLLWLQMPQAHHTHCWGLLPLATSTEGQGQAAPTFRMSDALQGQQEARSCQISRSNP